MDGERDSPGGPSSARRRRERRLRAANRHEQMSIRMVVAAMCHHSCDRSGGSAPAVTYADACTQTVAPLDEPPVTDFVAHTPAVPHVAPVFESVARAVGSLPPYEVFTEPTKSIRSFLLQVR